MKKEQVLAWYNKIKGAHLTPNDAIALILIGLYKQKDANFPIDHSIKNLITQGFIDENQMFTKKALSLLKIDINKDTEELAITLRGLFPRIIIPTSGKAARSSINEVINKLAWFKDNFNYPNEVIIKATEEYLEFFKQKSWSYMQTLAFFICKENKDKTKSSTLAEWCDKAENEEEVKSFDINI